MVVYLKDLQKGANQFVQDMFRAREEEQERRKNEMFARQERQRLIDTGVLNKDGTEKEERNPLQRFGDKTGELATGFVEGVKRTYSRAGEIGSNLLAEMTGVNREIEDSLRSIAEGDRDMLLWATKRSQDMTLSEDQRKRAKDLAEEYSAKSNESSSAVTSYYDEKVERYDPKKAAFAVAEVGLDVLTAGSVGAAVRGGRGLMKTGQLATKAKTAANLADPKVIKAAQKAADSRFASTVNKVLNPSSFKQSLASGSTLGVGYGITGTGVDMGDEATLGDFVKGGVTGGVVGAVFGGSINIVGKIGRSAFSKFKDRSTNTSEVAQEIIKEAPEDIVNQPGFVDRVNEMAANSRNVREMKEAYNSYTNELRSAANTAEDGGAAARAADDAALIPENRRLESGIEGQRLSNDEELARLQSGEDTSIYDYVDSQGNDVGEVARGYAKQISDIDQEIRAARASRNQLQRQSEGINENTGRADVPEGVDPSEHTGDATARAGAGEGVAKYDAEIADLQARKDSIIQEQNTAFERMGGVSRTVNADRARERFAQLRSERAAIDAAEDMMRSAPSAIQKQIDDLDNGIIPDDLIIDRGPAATADEVVERAMKTDPQDSIGLQRAYQQNQALIDEANTELGELMTTERYERLVSDYNENYKLKQEEINELPGPMKKQEQELLDQEYSESISDWQDNLAADKQRVEELNEALRVGDDINQNIVDEWNSMEQSNPNIFGEVDAAAVDMYRDRLVARQAELKIQEGKQPNNPIDKQENLDIAVQGTQNKAELDEMLGNDKVLEEALENLNDLTTGDTVNFLDRALRQPVKVLRKMGTAGNKIADVVSSAMDQRKIFQGELKARYHDKRWHTAMDEPYVDDFISFLDEGKAPTRGVQESSQHFERRKEALNDIKSWLRETGEKLGLPKEVLDRNYLPHLIKKESGYSPDRIAEALASIKASKNPNGTPITAKQRAEFERIIEGVSPQTKQYINQQKIYTVKKNGFLEKRTGAEGWERDPRKILNAYQRAATNELYMKPALKEVQSIAGKYQGKERQFIDEVMSLVKDQGMESGGRIAKGVAVARRAQNLALMGASIRTISMQLDGSNRVFTEAGFKAWSESSLAAFSSMNPRSKLYQQALRNGALEDSFSQLLAGQGGLAALANKTEKTLYAGITAVDTHMRIWAFDAGRKKYARSLGKNLNQLNAQEMAAANKAGREMAVTTQFEHNALTTPVSQNSPGGRFLTQLQQFNLAATAYNARTTGKGLKALGHPIKNKEDLMRLGRLVVSYGVLFGTMSNLATNVFGEEGEKWTNPLNFGPEDWYPLGHEILSGYQVAKGLLGMEGGIGIDEFKVPQAPLISFLFGSQFGDGLIDYATTVSKYRNGDIDEEQYRSAMSKLPRFLLRNIAPAGTQINRSLGGWETMEAGESINAYGNTRFLMQNKDGWNVMRGLIGGQYATDEGRAWLRNGMNTIGKHHTVTLADGEKMPVSQYARSLSPEDQAQYIGYYQTKQAADRELAKHNMGRTDVTNRLKDKINAGQMSVAQAQLEAQQWNDKVRALYGPYLNGNDNIPPRLVDDFQSSVIIDISLFERMRGRSINQVRQLNSYYE